MMQATQTAQWTERQVVVFDSGGEEFGVGIQDVREIIRIERIRAVPTMPKYVRGIINLRGKIIPVLDLALKLGMPQKEETHNSRILVIEVQGTLVGVIVDDATRVLELSQDQLHQAPAHIVAKHNAAYIEGVAIVNNHILILLNLAKALDISELKEVIA